MATHARRRVTDEEQTRKPLVLLVAVAGRVAIGLIVHAVLEMIEGGGNPLC